MRQKMVELIPSIPRISNMIETERELAGYMTDLRRQTVDAEHCSLNLFQLRKKPLFFFSPESLFYSHLALNRELLSAPLGGEIVFFFSLA